MGAPIPRDLLPLMRRETPAEKTKEFAKLDFNGPVPEDKACPLGGVKQLMTCPYNESHRVGYGSFAVHIRKCRKAAGPEVQDRMVICEYNATHHVDRSVYSEHLQLCDEYREYQRNKFELPQK